MLDASGIRSELEIGMKMGNSLEDRGGLRGEVTLECFDAEGNVRWSETRKNLITDVGDNYYAQRAIAAVVPATPADATKVTCMKLGTGSTAVAKNGAGAGIGRWSRDR